MSHFIRPSLRGRFTWDPKKAAANERDHGVTFDEARTVFSDPLAEYRADWEHAEARLIALGMSASERVLYVVHVELVGDTTRIISARKATRHERKRYEKGW